MKVIDASAVGVLNLGYAGEKDRTQVRFYYGDLLEEFPGGTILLQVSRPGEATKYDVLLETEDDYAIWTVDGYDCGVKGYGECQLLYSDSSVICKKKVWKTHIDQSVEGDDSSVPPKWEDAAEELLMAAAAVSSAIQVAETTLNAAVEAAEGYKTAAQTAQGKAEEAQTAAESAAGQASDSAAAALRLAGAAAQSAETASGYKTAAQTAQGKAEEAQTAAENAAGNASDSATMASGSERAAAQSAESAADDAASIREAMSQTTDAANTARTHGFKAEGYAVGTQSGSPVGNLSPYYQNNAAYYAEYASWGAMDSYAYARSAGEQAANAQRSANEAAESAREARSVTENLFHICSSQEYDSETGIPTIVDPDDKTFYLVPNGESTGNDLFVEWIYKNNAWEIFGSAKIDLSGYVLKTDIESTPTSESSNPISSGGVYTALSGKQDALTIDSAPTEDSTNPVTSGGVYTSVTNLSNKITQLGFSVANGKLCITYEEVSA